MVFQEEAPPLAEVLAEGGLPQEVVVRWWRNWRSRFPQPTIANEVLERTELRLTLGLPPVPRHYSEVTIRKILETADTELSRWALAANPKEILDQKTRIRIADRCCFDNLAAAVEPYLRRQRASSILNRSELIRMLGLDKRSRTALPEKFDLKRIAKVATSKEAALVRLLLMRGAYGEPKKILPLLKQPGPPYHHGHLLGLYLVLRYLTKKEPDFTAAAAEAAAVLQAVFPDEGPAQGQVSSFATRFLFEKRGNHLWPFVRPDETDEGLRGFFTARMYENTPLAAREKAYFLLHATGVLGPGRNIIQETFKHLKRRPVFFDFILRLSMEVVGLWTNPKIFARLAQGISKGVFPGLEAQEERKRFLDELVRRAANTERGRERLRLWLVCMGEIK